jgi:hypothetical protein
VGFLGVLDLALVLHRRLGEIVGVEFLADVGANFADRLVGEVHRVGAHVGDEADAAAADGYAFVELLRDTHGVAGGETELAHRLLLQGGGGEGGGGRALLALLLDLLHPGLTAGGRQQRGDDVVIAGGIIDVELVELLALVLEQFALEFLPSLVAVEVNGPVFARGERLDLLFALDDEA